MQPPTTNQRIGRVPDPVIEAYKNDVDRTLLLENLRLSVEQRSKKFENSMRLCFELRKNAKEMQGKSSSH